MGYPSISLIKELYSKTQGKKIKPRKIKLDNYAPKVLKQSLKLRVVDV